MNAVIFRFLWRRHRLTILLCSIAPILVGVMIGFIYPSYSKQRALLQTFKIAGRFFGGEQVDLFSAAGAFTLPFQHPIVLALFGVAAGCPVIALPAGERGRRGLDLLLAAPLERRTLMVSLLAFVLSASPLIASACAVGALAGATIAGEAQNLPFATYFLLVVNAFGLLVCLAGLGAVLSAIAEDRAQMTTWYAASVFLAMALDVAARLWQSQSWIGYLGPYGYFRPAEAVARGGSGIGADIAVLLSAAGLAFAAATFVMSRRRSA